MYMTYITLLIKYNNLPYRESYSPLFLNINHLVKLCTFYPLPIHIVNITYVRYCQILHLIKDGMQETALM